MNGNTRVTFSPSFVAVAAIALLAVGAGTTYWLMRRAAAGADRSARGMAGTVSAPTPSEPPRDIGLDLPSGGPEVRLPDVVVTLSQDAIKRAGIELAPAASGAGSAAVRIPGIVEPNAYKQVVVTPLVGGRVTRVLVELGDQVRSGQTLAQVFSPELADAQSNYLSAQSALDAHDRELGRSAKLVAIGAASQQELDRLHAEHAAMLAGLQSLRSRLVLLGMPPPAIDALGAGAGIEATADIPAPAAGVITERGVNVGLNVDTATKLFTVVDLSSVWVVGALYERDFSRVHVGSTASVTTTAYPGLALQGRVSYIDPQVNAETRTARVRVEAPNPRHELRLGMYADVAVMAATGREAFIVPRSAIQNVGDRQVVYVAHPTAPGIFTEREVRLGDTSGDQVEVASGIQLGDQVVSKGSFFVRAERERLGLRPAGGVPGTP